MDDGTTHDTSMGSAAAGPVVVIGSLNMDLIVRVAHMPAAGETLAGDGFATAPGGKGANQAVAAARLGAPVVLVGRVGQDPHGRELVGALDADGIVTSQVEALAGVPTGVAVIVVEADGQNRIVLAPGANARVDDAAVERADAVIASASVLVLQLEVPLATVVRAAVRARAAGVPVLLNPAPAQPLPEALWSAVDMLVVNESEAALLAGVQVVDAASAHAAADVLRLRGPRVVIVTLGASGVAWIDGQGRGASPAHQVHAVDTTAAGDTFIGALAAAWREGQPLRSAIALGQAASALCVTRRGAQPSIPWRRELVGEFAPRDTAA